MTVSSPALRWLALLAAACVVRIAWFSAKGGMYFPDEVFQYLEPAHWRVTGDAFLAWELEVGARHWLLPTFWSSFLELGRTLGLRRWELHRFLAFHAAMLSVLVVPAVFRIVRASTRDERAGWLAASLAALCPLLGFFAPHTLSELPTMLLLAFAHALWIEISAKPDAPGATRSGWIAGALLAIAVACRVPSAMSVPIIIGDLVIRRSRAQRVLLATVLGFAAGATVIGAIDALTWGTPWHSLVAFVRANVQYEDALARRALAEPWHFYLSAAWRCMGPAAPVLAALAVFSARRHARLLIAWVLPLGALSVLANKQDRFLLPLLPLFLASAACGLADVSSKLAIRERSRPILFGTVLFLSLAALPAAVHLPRKPWAGTFRAQAWIGEHRDASGVLVDGGEYMNGGYLLLDRSVPLAPFSDELAGHRLFNYVIAFSPALVARMESETSFEQVVTFDDTRVFRRRRR